MIPEGVNPPLAPPSPHQYGGGSFFPSTAFTQARNALKQEAEFSPFHLPSAIHRFNSTMGISKKMVRVTTAFHWPLTSSEPREFSLLNIILQGGSSDQEGNPE